MTGIALLWLVLALILAALGIALVSSARLLVWGSLLVGLALCACLEAARHGLFR